MRARGARYLMIGLLWIGGTGIVPMAGLWVFIDCFDGPWRLAYIGSVQLIIEKKASF